MKKMTYRTMAGGDRVSLLGFGCMRFPTKGGEIEEARAEKMLDEAMAAGVNYYDTAYVYHGGKSETFLGKTLVKKYPRDSFYLATKLPMWDVHSVEDAERIFDVQLSRLGTSYVDYFLFHSMNRDSFKKLKDLNLIALAEKWREQGKLRHIGFSFHDSYEVFDEMIHHYKWDFCQIQYNYMDTENQAGLKGLTVAEELGIPVVVMEPIRGGSLVRFPEEIKNEFSAINPSRNLANWALTWVGTHENVKVILSGMSTLGQVRDNLKTFRNFAPLTEKEMQGVAGVVDTIRARVRNGCTGCRYCMPCPFGVDIPRAFAISNEEAMHGHTEHYKKQYLRGKPETFASRCQSCHACEKKCPQHIAIADDLRAVKELFEN